MHPRVRKLGILVGIGAAGYLIDKHAYSSTIQRNTRTVWNALLISLDYKLNFNPGDPTKIDALHERVARRMYNVCKENGGLYIKFGQQVATVPVLPSQYHAIFRQFYDNAPAEPYEVVEQVFAQEFGGLKPSDIFETFSHKAIASASIAQVHQATLKDGTRVAVKIQKPQIAHQMGWDMLCYRLILFTFEKLFDLPLYWSADYIEKHIRQETDFLHEGKNGEECFKHIQEMPSLRGRLYVPKIFWDYSSKRVLTAEWIEGIRFTETERLEKSGYSIKEIMTAIVDVFSDQIFRTGLIHCDPHPGNIIVRPRPDRLNSPQVVLLDHGLYVRCSPDFTHDYSVFWKSLFVMDEASLQRITENWGISDIGLFASATLQKTWVPGKAVHVDTTNAMSDLFDRHVQAKEKLKSFLKDTKLIPRELIFVGRNMNCVRANNRSLGSPVNRINIMANWAVSSLGNDWSVWSRQSPVKTKSRVPWPIHCLSAFIQSRANYLFFRSTLWLTSVTFYATQLYQKIVWVLFGQKTAGFEGITDAAMKKAIQEQFGLEVDDSVFEG